MAKAAVLDSSALLALMRNESGSARIAEILPIAIVSTVSFAEIEAKLVAAGLTEQQAWWHISQLCCESAPFDDEQARIAGGLARLAPRFHLSFAERACLALALQRKATAYSTNPSWNELNLDIETEVIA